MTRRCSSRLGSPPPRTTAASSSLEVGPHPTRSLIVRPVSPQWTSTIEHRTSGRNSPAPLKTQLSHNFFKMWQTSNALCPSSHPRRAPDGISLPPCGPPAARGGRRPWRGSGNRHHMAAIGTCSRGVFAWNYVPNLTIELRVIVTLLVTTAGPPLARWYAAYCSL